MLRSLLSVDAEKTQMFLLFYNKKRKEAPLPIEECHMCLSGFYLFLVFPAVKGPTSPPDMLEQQCCLFIAQLNKLEMIIICFSLSLLDIHYRKANHHFVIDSELEINLLQTP